MNKIKLIKTGGLVGTHMSASAAWQFSGGDWNELVNAIKRDSSPTKARDNFHYAIQQDGDEKTRVPVSIQSIPEKFTGIFKELFDNMKAGD